MLHLTASEVKLEEFFHSTTAICIGTALFGLLGLSLRGVGGRRLAAGCLPLK